LGLLVRKDTYTGCVTYLLAFCLALLHLLPPLDLKKLQLILPARSATNLDFQKENAIDADGIAERCV
jgi:hypothetical protein